MPPTLVISINASWNIVNFRAGLIRGLRQAGYRVAALAPRDAWSDRLGALGVEFHPIEMDRKSLSPARDLRLLWRYRRELRRVRPAVFLGYTAKPNIWGSIAAQSLGIPVINNVSGLGTAFIRGGWLGRLVAALYRLAFRGSATVFFQNDEDRNLFVARGIVAAEKARLLPGSGIDTTQFRPAAKSRQDGGFVFLLVGRLLRDKGIGEYVEAARRVRREAPETRFRLLGFLDSDNRSAFSRPQLESWVEEGLIDYLGASDDVRPAIAEADCVVLPSYREGLPRTLLEAAAMGKPLIATDVPGCRQPERRAEWGRKARAIVEAEYDERIVVESYLAAIAEAIGPA
jgi:glycosyltransferase involved in cell wall biosynthesis